MKRLFSAAAFLVACALCACAPELAAAATAGVNVDVKARVNGTYVGTNDLGTPVFPFDVQTLIQLTAGTGTGKADKVFSDQRTLAASATENLDLAGVLTDPLGGTLTFVHVKAILILADAANTNNVVVGGATTNAFAGPLSAVTDYTPGAYLQGTVAIPPGGAALLTHGGAGWTVTAATGDILKILNSGGTTGVTYKVLIIGTSN